MHLRRESGAHIDSVRARDPGLRMPSSSGRAISASFAEISDETRIKNRDRLSSRSSRVWTIVGYLRCLVTASRKLVNFRTLTWQSSQGESKEDSGPPTF